jgi:hypothetical protein
MVIAHKSKFGEPISHQICMFYDPADGRVVHVDHYVQYPGGPTFTENEVKALGLHVLGGRNVKPEDVHALSVPAGDYDERANYRIDVTTRRLIKIETN